MQKNASFLVRSMATFIKDHHETSDLSAKEKLITVSDLAVENSCS